jgi:hypothetical protein
MHALTFASAVVAFALIAAAHEAAYAQHEKQPFCLQGPRGSMNCTYDSLEQVAGSAAWQQGSSAVAGALTRLPAT